jgi:hypothetical protein
MVRHVGSRSRAATDRTLEVGRGLARRGIAVDRGQALRDVLAAAAGRMRLRWRGQGRPRQDWPRWGVPRSSPVGPVPYQAQTTKILLVPLPSFPVDCS